MRYKGKTKVAIRQENLGGEVVRLVIRGGARGTGKVLFSVEGAASVARQQVEQFLTASPHLQVFGVPWK
jgi:hypothetical protein